MLFIFIKDLYHGEKPVISLEIFPPKKDDGIKNIMDILGQVTSEKPAFVSVTYGASGNHDSVKYSETVANAIKNQYGSEALFHFTCVNNTKENILNVLDSLEKINIKNILALRGDLPHQQSENSANSAGDFVYATDLIALIKERGGFCVGAACYPEGHITESDMDKQYDVLNKKQHAGADFFISQLFFENRYFLNFRDKAYLNGIVKPLIAGIMPILSKSQIDKMIYMCGVSLPGTIVKMLYKYKDSPKDLRKAGIEYALCQAEELINEGVDGVHFYTMNQPDIALDALLRLKK